MLIVLIVVFLALAAGGGGWGYQRYGWAGMSPAGVMLVVVAILYFTGRLQF